MKLEDALKVLEENRGHHLIDCFIPSLKKDVSFKPLTIGKIKTISKILLDTDEDINQLYLPLTSIAVDLCIDQSELDLSKINEIDRIKILLTLKNANSLSENIFDVKCHKCKAEFNVELDMEKSFKRLSTVPESIVKTFQNGDVKYTIEFNLPSVALTLKFRQNIQELKKAILNDDREFTSELEEKLDFYILKMGDSLYIKSVKINDELVEGLESKTIQERNSFIDQLPFEIIEFISDEIYGNNKFDIPSPIREEIICPTCKTKQPLEMEINDFFLI